ncbi:MAG: PHP domain-containing protein [Oscillospiraceae bacterium]|nr:PHP domain-containing protein [Oscillospiraceae bacterium]
MELYKYETHLHTSQGSLCSCSSGAEQAENLKRCGYTGMFVTDHFFGGNTAVDRRLPWDVKIHLFCQGYEDTKKKGDEIGLQVFFGWEYAYRGTELLTYGLDKQFLLDHPELDNMELPAYCDLVHSCGGFVVHAHPFREAGYLDTIRLFPRKVDGVEAVNASHRDPEFDRRAQMYAEAYGIPMSGGSDTHTTWSFPGGGIVLDKPLEDAHDYLKRLQNDEITAILEASNKYMFAQPDSDVWHTCKRPDISLLPEEQKRKAEDFYTGHPRS